MAEAKQHQQVLWLYGDDQQLTEVGTMNLFVHWVNENGGVYCLLSPTVYACMYICMYAFVCVCV